jgi:hypothetical protein
VVRGTRAIVAIVRLAVQPRYIKRRLVGSAWHYNCMLLASVLQYWRPLGKCVKWVVYHLRMDRCIRMHRVLHVIRVCNLFEGPSL